MSQFSTKKPVSKTIKGNGDFVFIDRPVESFSRIQTLGDVDIEFKQADQLMVRVHADSNLQSIITTEIKDDTLHVSKKEKTSYQTKSDMYVEVQAPELKSANIVGDGDVTIKGLAGKSFSGQIIGDGDMKIKGQVDNALFDISGDGDLKAKKLKAKRVEIVMSGDGDAKVSASDFIGVALTGDGDLIILGNPAEKEIEHIGDGDIDFE